MCSFYIFVLCWVYWFLESMKLSERMPTWKCHTRASRGWNQQLILLTYLKQSRLLSSDPDISLMTFAMLEPSWLKYVANSRVIHYMIVQQSCFELEPLLFLLNFLVLATHSQWFEVDNLLPYLSLPMDIKILSLQMRKTLETRQSCCRCKWLIESV